MHLCPEEVIEKFNMLQYNIDCGEDILKKVREGEIRPKAFNQLSDDDFVSMVLDMHISDKNLSEMFSTTEYQVKKRRKRQDLPRGGALINKWFFENRKPVNINTIIKNISDI